MMVKKNRYQELLDELSKLSDTELLSYCFTEKDKEIIQLVLENKHK